jgi:hypothetical protein
MGSMSPAAEAPVVSALLRDPVVAHQHVASDVTPINTGLRYRGRVGSEDEEDEDRHRTDSDDVVDMEGGAITQDKPGRRRKKRTKGQRKGPFALGLSFNWRDVSHPKWSAAKIGRAFMRSKLGLALVLLALMLGVLGWSQGRHVSGLEGQGVGHSTFTGRVREYVSGMSAPLRRYVEGGGRQGKAQGLENHTHTSHTTLPHEAVGAKLSKHTCRA